MFLDPLRESGDDGDAGFRIIEHLAQAFASAKNSPAAAHHASAGYHSVFGLVVDTLCQAGKDTFGVAVGHYGVFGIDEDLEVIGSVLALCHILIHQIANI